LGIEDPRSKLLGIFDRKESSLFRIRSLTPPQAAGNALAIAVQLWANDSLGIDNRGRTANFSIKIKPISVATPKKIS